MTKNNGLQTQILGIDKKSVCRYKLQIGCQDGEIGSVEIGTISSGKGGRDHCLLAPGNAKSAEKVQTLQEYFMIDSYTGQCILLETSTDEKGRKMGMWEKLKQDCAALLSRIKEVQRKRKKVPKWSELQDRGDGRKCLL